MPFDAFNLHPRVVAGIDAMGFTEPTPIQERAIPPGLAGRDVLGLAQTGTGKTAAFALPILHHLIDGPRGRIRALVVTPTRELAEQIHQTFVDLGRATGLRSATVYGGVGMTPQVRALRGRAEIIVACPGRLLDHMQRGNVDLRALETVVLDEADHMFDMGFLPDVRRIMAKVPDGAQRLLFSATMPPDLRRLADGVLRDPVTVEIGHSAPAETVEHALYPVARERKTELLKHLLRSYDARSVLVFTRTKRGAKRLADTLDRANFFATSLQGNLSQNRRQRALDDFRNGDIHVLVATDIASRGIDVEGVSHVINFDVPTTAEAYTHRIGRTGRAERSGEALTLVTAEDAKAVRTIERGLGAPIARVRLDGFADGVGEIGGAPDQPSRAQRRAGGQRGRNRNGARSQERSQGQGPGQRQGQNRDPQRRRRRRGGRRSAGRAGKGSGSGNDG